MGQVRLDRLRMLRAVVQPDVDRQEYPGSRSRARLARLPGTEDTRGVKYDGPVEIDAGAILLDGPVDSACRVAVIQRVAPADWSLPKGHLESGESLEEAARREVLEETGYAATCMGIAGAIAYIHDGRAKSATFFYFQRDTVSPEHDDLDGVCGVEWLSFEEARARVSYPELSDLLARAQLGGSPPRKGSTLLDVPRRMALLGRLSTRDDRLRLAIETYARELTGLRSRPRTPGDEYESTWWRPAADSLLELARALRDRGGIDSAWDALNASKRLSLHELSEAGLTSHAEVLKAEVESKLRGWRKVAAGAALSRADEASSGPGEVACAQRVLDADSSSLPCCLRSRLLVYGLPRGWVGSLASRSTRSLLSSCRTEVSSVACSCSAFSGPC